MIKLFENWLQEKKLASIRRKLTITVDIESTKHAQERQSRHLKDGGRFITEDEIAKLMSKSISDITELLVFDKIDIGQAIVLKDKNTNLHIACEVEGKEPKLNLKAITVMIHPKFKIGKDQILLEY